MKVEDLKNYGKPLSELMLSPEAEVQGRRAIRSLFVDLRRELGLIGTIRLVLRMRQEARRMKKRDWATLYGHGPLDPRFLERLITQTAGMKALSDMVGTERASAIYASFVDRVGYDVMAPMFPSVAEFRECGDAFEAFKQYARAMIEADMRAGLHDVDIVEDTPGAFAYNVKYCVWNEVASVLGVSSLCYSARCYGDEVLFNTVMPQIGAVYRRTGTLTLGQPVCDVRFELTDR